MTIRLLDTQVSTTLDHRTLYTTIDVRLRLALPLYEEVENPLAPLDEALKERDSRAFLRRLAAMVDGATAPPPVRVTPRRTRELDL